MNRIRIFGVVLALAGLAGCKEDGARSSGKGTAAHSKTALATEELAARLEAAYRDDKLPAGLAAAQEVAGAETDDVKLIGLAARAFYRAGDLVQASQLIGKVDTTKAEAPLLLTGARLSRAQGNLALAERSLEMAQRLAANDPEILHELVYVRMDQGRYADAAQVAEALDRALENARGYPVELLKVFNAGRAEFLKKAGAAPLNVVQHGSGKMVWSTIQDFQRPYLVEARINGHGPYNLAIDLIGGAYLSLPPKLAEEAQIAPLAEGSVLTLDGPRQAQWGLAQSVELGTAHIERVVTRVFEEPAKPDYPPDGVIGIGVFKDHRATLNRVDGRFEVSPSGPLEADAQTDRGSEPLFYLADHRPTFITEIEGRRVLATIGSYVVVTTQSQSLRLELYPDTKSMGPPGEEGYPTPGVGSGLSEAHLGTSPACLERALCVDTEFCGRGVPLFIAIDAAFNESYIDKLLGAHPDVFYGVDITERMEQIIIDAPRRQLQIKWIHVPEPATQPASAPATSASPNPNAAQATATPAAAPVSSEEGFTPIDAPPPTP